jgi:hypothetical protein
MLIGAQQNQRPSFVFDARFGLRNIAYRKRRAANAATSAVAGGASKVGCTDLRDDFAPCQARADRSSHAAAPAFARHQLLRAQALLAPARELDCADIDAVGVLR